MDKPPAAPPSVIAHSKEREHGKILSILHFVYGALAIAMIGFLILHYSVMSSVMDFQDTMMTDPEIKSELDAVGYGQSMEIINRFFLTMYLVSGFSLLVVGILNILAGVGLLKFQWKALIYVASALNCLSVPLGTTLAVFTFMNLAKPEVSRLFERLED